MVSNFRARCLFIIRFHVRVHVRAPVLNHAFLRQNEETYTFEEFVESFDETDRFTKRLVEFLVKV